jgi:hypothetical protein
MARFYQPSETQGIYDRSANRLTVNQYDTVRIGFRAASSKEYEATTVDTSENVEDGRVQIDALAYEIDIDTSKPVTFKVTATQDVIMSAVGKEMARPLEVVVRRQGYIGQPAVGQKRDPAGCWAACLSYWLSAADGRDPRRFEDILGDFNGVWDTTGFLNVHALRRQIQGQRSRYRMVTEQVGPSRLDGLLGRWPLLVGFKHPGGFGHMNILTAYDDSASLVRAMDPWFPDPPPDSFMRADNGQLIFNGNEGDFAFTGYIAYRQPGYYHSPMRSGTIVVGYPEEYVTRMP